MGWKLCPVTSWAQGCFLFTMKDISTGLEEAEGLKCDSDPKPHQQLPLSQQPPATSRKLGPYQDQSAFRQLWGPFSLGWADE